MPLTDDIKDLIEHETTNAQHLLRYLAAALPKSVEVQQLLAKAYWRRLEFQQAITHFREVLNLDPRDSEALNAIPMGLLQLGDYPAALEAFRHALKTTSSASAMRFVALLSHRQGQVDDAIRTYERLLGAAQPTSAEIPFVLQGLAAALRDAGRPIAADHYTRLLIERFRRGETATASEIVNRNTSDEFHGWSAYADKSRLAQALTARKPADPSGRFPESFVLPQDRAALDAFAKGPDAPRLYIVKPIRASGGQGISVTADLAPALDRADVVVQRYIDRPHLIEGRKGHCRIYCLVTATSPLRAYIYSEGIVRIAPQPYDPSPEHAFDVSMHVTNTALHLGHPGLSVSEDPGQDDVGSIRSLSALLRRMTAEGLDGQAVFGEIRDLVTWFVRLLDADGLFARQAAVGPARAFPAKLFGLDVLIDDEGHPWLIEMQRMPAAKGAPLVERINGEMFVSIFHMQNAVLLDDGVSPDLMAALRTDDTARRRREAELEFAARGKFVPLDL